MHWRLNLQRSHQGFRHGGPLPPSAPAWVHDWLRHTGSLTQALSRRGDFRVQCCYQGRIRLVGGWRVRARAVALCVNDLPVVWAMTLLLPPGGRRGLLAHPRCDWPFWRTLGERSLGTALARRLPVQFRQPWAPRQRALRQQQQTYQRLPTRRWQSQIWRPVQQSCLRQGKRLDPAMLPEQLQGWSRQRGWQPPRISPAQATVLWVIECFAGAPPA